MDTTTRLAWMSSVFKSGRDEHEPTDYADMGTAFGLDASLPPADPFGPDPAPAHAPWERRLVRRSEL